MRLLRGLKRVRSGFYKGSVFYEHEAEIEHSPDGWSYVLHKYEWAGFGAEHRKVSSPVLSGHARTLKEAQLAIEAYGRTPVKSVNILSGKEITIPLEQKGGCCDPGTETYWSM